MSSTEGRQSHSIAAMLDQNARLFGQMPAMSGDTGGLSHTQLRDLVTRTVHAINRAGIGRGDRVAIVLPQGPGLAAAFLAIGAGATAAPLNPAYLESEFAFYLKDLQARALVVLQGMESPVRTAAASLGIPIFEWIPSEGGADRLDVSSVPESMPAQGGFAEPGDEALVLHTSGTTSKPKQVPLTQQNLLASARHIVTTLQLQPNDRCLNVMPLFHIHGLVACLLASLTAGGSIVCTRGFAANQFPGWLERWQPTWYSAVPTMHQAILAHLQHLPGGIGRHSLRFARSSSAALPPAVMKGLEDVLETPVIEAYGMTEAAHQIASNPLPPGERKPGSVGRAAGPRIAILNDQGSALPPGQTGEVAIQGPNVTAGYFKNPQANTAAFSGEWFRTGDQGYVDDEGYLFLTGRLKELINRGGEKVAPREIDEVLLSYPGVRQAVAFAVPHPTLGEDIAAAVVLSAGTIAGETELRSFALTRLPVFKVPTRIVVVDDVPKGPTGKIQRIGLAAKLAEALGVRHEEPASDTERLVADTISEVLGAGVIGRDDNFFFLGGDSLRAMQVLNRLQGALDINIPVETLFQFPTPALLADNLKRLKDSDLDALAADLEQLSDEERAKLLSDL
jgi:oxalate---CoA ligase